MGRRSGEVGLWTTLAMTVMVLGFMAGYIAGNSRLRQEWMLRLEEMKIAGEMVECRVPSCKKCPTFRFKTIN